MKTLPPITPRTELLSLVERHVKQARQHQRFAGLLLCDIRRFRYINSSHGYQAGDEVIKEVFDRLAPLAQSDDGLVRSGPNEFALILPFLESPIIAQLAGDKVLRVLANSGFGDNQAIQGKPAIGIALSCLKKTNPEALCLLAETALSQSKKHKQPLVILEQQEDQVQEDIEAAIEHALVNDELELLFQPKVNLHTGIPDCSEALLRWKKEDGGFVSPSQFIPKAEELRLMDPITEWVIKNTIRAASQYPENMLNYGVAINISGALLDATRLDELLKNTQTIWNVDPRRITLEITESAFMEDIELTMELFATLREKYGVRVAIDDFGTGYCSLQYFKHIPADELKIDKSFIDGIKHCDADRKIVELTIQLAKNFNLDVVAEGVEDEETFNLVGELGCDYVQGFYISKPLDFDQYVKWSEEYHCSRQRRLDSTTL